MNISGYQAVQQGNLMDQQGYVNQTERWREEGNDKMRTDKIIALSSLHIDIHFAMNRRNYFPL
jgi:sulfur relay (sulfurtransferase) DsrC/TusE family protein